MTGKVNPGIYERKMMTVRVLVGAAIVNRIYGPPMIFSRLSCRGFYGELNQQDFNKPGGGGEGGRPAQRTPGVKQTVTKAAQEKLN